MKKSKIKTPYEVTVSEVYFSSNRIGGYIVGNLEHCTEVFSKKISYDLDSITPKIEGMFQEVSPEFTQHFRPYLKIEISNGKVSKSKYFVPFSQKYARGILDNLKEVL